MNWRQVKTGILILGVMCCCMVAGCPSAGRNAYQQGLRAYDAGDYQQALTLFDEALEKEPDSVMVVYGRALSLYKLQRYEEAIAAFEEFIDKSESERASFQDERKDAAFYRDKCKLELGMELEQNERAIPPPPMGE